MLPALLRHVLCLFRRNSLTETVRHVQKEASGHRPGMPRQPDRKAVEVLEDVIDACVTQRRAGTLSNKAYFATEQSLYHECWRTMNQWILSCMKRRQGVEIPFFGILSWEQFTHEGEDRCRPVCVPSKALCEAFRLEYKPPPPSPTLARAEKLSYSRVAIRYSRTLTRDMLFMGLRDIFRKIGELIEGRELRIRFHVGQLMVKERKIAFEFDITAFVSGGDAPAEVRSRTAPAPASPQCPVGPPPPRAPPPRPQTVPTSHGQRTRVSLAVEAPTHWPRPSTASAAGPRGGTSDMVPLHVITEAREAARAAVLEQSLQRHLCALEAQAAQDESLRRVMAENLLNGRDEESKRRDACRHRRLDLRAQLLQQMEERRARREQLKTEGGTTSVATSLTLQAEGGRKSPVLSQEELVTSLAQQVQRKKERSAADRAEKLAAERQMLDSIREEMTREDEARRAKKRQAAASLKASWDTERQLLGARHVLQRKGGTALRKYLSDVVVAPGSPAVGVGFDSRGC